MSLSVSEWVSQVTDRDFNDVALVSDDIKYFTWSLNVVQMQFNPILLGGGQICPRTFFWKNYSAELYKCHIFWLLEIFSTILDLNNFQKKPTG